MRNLYLVMALMVITISCQKQARDESQLAPTESKTSKQINFYGEKTKSPTHEKGVVLFKLKNNSSLSRVAGRASVDRIYTKAMQKAGDRGFYKGRFMDEMKALQQLRANPDVEWASLNYAEVTQTTPDDIYWNNGDMWGLQNINMPQVWQSGNFGNKQVYVGVIDEGIFGHEDLCQNIWRNPYELDNGIDDDGNGYIDDFNGWDWFNNDNQVYPGATHGTHVAGTIGAKGGNQIGVVGVCSNVTLISCKFLEQYGYDDNAVKAIDYLIDMKQRHGLNIKVTSNSWGGGGFNQGLLEAIQRAKAADILFVAAAGNHAANNDTEPNYPSNYDVDNIIAVGASQWDNTKASFSCYGATTVDIFAPGTGIVSTVPTDQHTSGYAFFSGTSMATPHVSGAAALYSGLHPEANYLQIKNAILNAATKVPALKGLCLGNEVGGNFLNVSTFTGQTAENQPPFYDCPEFTPDNNPPSVPTGVEVYDVGFDPREGAFYGGYFGCKWNPSIDPEGSAVGYIVWFNDAPEWALYGGSTNWVFAGLDTTQDIIVRVVAVDSWGNSSGFSNSDTASWHSQPPPPPDTQAPIINGNPTLSNITQNSIRVNWVAASDNVGVTGYDIYRDGVKVSTTTALSYSDNALQPSTTYIYFYVAKDAAGNQAQSGSVSGTTLNPPPPPPSCNVSALLGVNNSAMTANINWTVASTCEYTTRLERKKGSNGAFSTLANNPASPYVDVVPSPGFYTYRLAVVTGAQTTYSNEVTIKASKK